MDRQLLNSSMISETKARIFLEHHPDLFTDMAVQDSGIKPRYHFDPDIKAVLFDIYGTLLISEAGDIGLTALEQGTDREFILKSRGSALDVSYNTIKTLLRKGVESHHKKIRMESADIMYPEVDIISLWDEIFQSLKLTDYDVNHLSAASLHFELMSNRVCLMPGLLPLFDFLKTLGLPLGIVSNAQFYTPLLFEYLCGRGLQDMGFDNKLLSWSYKMSCGKPDPLIFISPLDELNRRGIMNHEILYLGNDMLNDIATAAKMGMKTALFAGDRRSLRLREDDSRVKGVNPDQIVTELAQMTKILQEGMDENEG